MTKDQFKILITDLYTLYNREKLIHVDALSEKYKDMTYDFVDNVLITYNNKNLPYFDPKKDEKEYRQHLLREYAQGNRILQNASIQDEIKKANDIKLQEEKKRTEEIAKAEREKKEIIAKTEEDKPKLKEEILKDAITYNRFEVSIQNNYTEKNLQIPEDKTHLFFLSKGSRILLPDQEGKPVGLEVIDVVCDLWSMNDKVSLLIIIDKPHD
jgi:hypothetical protein